MVDSEFEFNLYGVDKKEIEVILSFTNQTLLF